MYAILICDQQFTPSEELERKNIYTIGKTLIKFVVLFFRSLLTLAKLIGGQLQQAYI